jgi:hypothetical protein
MRKRRAEFMGSDMQPGVFYPRNYVILGFDSFEAAEHAERAMLGAGMMRTRYTRLRETT